MIYYNEIDKKAVAWLWQLMEAGVIAQGIVDERSIEDVVPNDLKGFTQCHFFAGIGVWSYALRSAGWPDDRPVWTGSCPCQPFSTAGKRGGFADERHLWPAWYHLISQCRPVTVFGEQVASKDGLAWLDTVYADLEGAGYAVGANDICAAGFGAPHIRQRLYFVADAKTSERRHLSKKYTRGRTEEAGGCSRFGNMADAKRDDWRTNEPGREQEGRAINGRLGPTNGFWADADWLPCRDGKARPVESGIEPLVDGITKRMGHSGDNGVPINANKTAEARVMRLRGYGNAIVAPVAIEFIRAFLDENL